MILRIHVLNDMIGGIIYFHRVAWSDEISAYTIVHPYGSWVAENNPGDNIHRMPLREGHPGSEKPVRSLNSTSGTKLS